jgi:5-(carboxyamino)imidazole ribonucleotide synthase
MTSVISDSSGNPELLPAGPLARVGIIGGGQLGRMMTKKAKQLGCEVHVLDPYPQSPAGTVATYQTVGRFDDPATIREVVEACDVTTYDIEHIDAEILATLEKEGHTIYPTPALLAVVQDKLLQKELLVAHDIPTAPFLAVDEPSMADMEAFGFPLVQKARKGGYDGKGVSVLRSAEEVGEILHCPSILEKMVDIDVELAVMVARNPSGEIVTYPVTEMEFDMRANLLDLLLVPARISDTLAEEARALAARVVKALDGVGVFGVEMFLDKSGDLLVNEVAPRPHNSGHYTLDACVTCQFEQHMRAILGMPLGASHLWAPAAMINLIGEPGSSGPARIAGLPEALATPGASVHIYGKTECRPFRKMGHITVVDDRENQALVKAKQLRDIVTFHGANPE